MFAIVLSLLSAAIPTTVQQEPSATLNTKTWTAWRDHIAPRAQEERWQAIAWDDNITAGIKTADATNRPMLLWLMNGHPLGCT